MLEWVRDLPKASLHLHLEGSVEPETLRELQPSLTNDDIAAATSYSDFAGFLQAYVWVNRLLRSPDDYALIARRLLERLAGENVRYAEVTLSAGMVLWKEQKFGPVYDAVQREAEVSPVEVRWIVDAVRQFGVEHVSAVAKLAMERAGDGVVALGIGGDEQRGPASWFGDVFRRVKDAGLHLHAHAGETAGPEGVWQALSIGAERIGHGIRSIEDPDLLEELRRRRVPLEICITSNVRTGAVSSLHKHPVRRLFDAGVPIVVDTDDPALFACTLAGEYELLSRGFGFSREEVERIALNSFEFAFGLPKAQAI
jgi:adenosine deaminase/aminodeoxyfutalosine deaminase